MNPDSKLELTAGLVNSVLQYLGTRPYGEVFRLIQEIQAQAIPQAAPSAEPAAE